MELLNSLSTGAYCMTTMHLDDIRDMPDRMYSMLGKGESSERFINSIYKYIDLVVLVDCDRFEKKKNKGGLVFLVEIMVITAALLYLKMGSLRMLIFQKTLKKNS